MNNFIELETKTYMGKEFKDFMDKSGFDGSNKPLLDDGDEWKRELFDSQEDVELPKSHIVKVYIDPSKIIAYFESFSMEEAYLNPQKPKRDMVDIHLQGGLEVTAICSIKQFNKKLEDYYSSNIK